MKSGVTYVEQGKFLAIAQELGLSTKEQKGFVKVWDAGKGENAQRLYVAKTKKVGRVDLSGFEVEFGAQHLGGEKFGGVSQQLDMSLPEEDILTNFRALCEHMKSLPAPAPKERKAREPKAEGKVQGTAPAHDPMAEKRSLLARKQKAVEIATKRGAEVSQELVAEIKQLEEELTAPAAQ